MKQIRQYRAVKRLSGQSAGFPSSFKNVQGVAKLRQKLAGRSGRRRKGYTKGEISDLLCAFRLMAGNEPVAPFYFGRGSIDDTSGCLNSPRRISRTAVVRLLAALRTSSLKSLS